MSISKGIEALRSAIVNMGAFVDIIETEADIADPAVFAGRCEVFKAIVEERARQEAKFPGQQLPLWVSTFMDERRETVAAGDGDALSDAATYASLLPSEQSIKDSLANRARGGCGDVTWALVLVEEVVEFVAALGRGDATAARTEGVQVMAVVLRIFESDAFKALEGK